MKTMATAARAVLGAVLLGANIPAVQAFLRIDGCLDAGGAWDEKAGACITAAQEAAPGAAAATPPAR